MQTHIKCKKIKMCEKELICFTDWHHSLLQHFVLSLLMLLVLSQLPYDHFQSKHSAQEEPSYGYISYTHDSFLTILHLGILNIDIDVQIFCNIVVLDNISLSTVLCIPFQKKKEEEKINQMLLEKSPEINFFIVYC